MIGYRVTLAPDDNGTVLVTCPALPMVATYGATAEEARAHARDAIAVALASMIADGEEVPPFVEAPDADVIALPLLGALKVQLYRVQRRAGVTRAELARRLGWHREQVDRLFRLDHASRLDQVEAAFRALGHRVEVAVKAAA